MKVLVQSLVDQASMNISEKLLQMVEHSVSGEFGDRPVYALLGWHMVTIDVPHIHADRLDREIAEALETPEILLFLSKHRSESGRRTLSVHPPGNPGSADLGGKPRYLPPSAPDLMTSALRYLHRHAGDMDYQVSFEVTHHGPYLETPSFFMEIGSTEREWNDPEAAEAVAKAIIDTIRDSMRGVHIVGLGGGHYAPRFTEVALRRRVSFGHMIPAYHLDPPDEDIIRQAMDRSSAEGVYIHRKSLKGPVRRKLMAYLDDMGVKVYRSESEFEPL